MTSPIDDRSIHPCTNERPAACRRVSLLTAGLVALAALLGAPRSASALQPLGEFLESSKTRSPDNKVAAGTTEQRSGEADQAWGRILPGFTARGAYTRNQYGSSFGPTVITPQNQWDGFLILDVPLIDVGGWSRVSASRALHEASKERARATVDEVNRVIAQRYYQLVASEALIESSQRSVQAAEESARIAQIRKDAGAATELDVQRAAAEVEANRQRYADADYLRSVSRRALQSLSGLTPAGGAPKLTDDLTPEAGLESWGGSDVSPLPSVRASGLERKAAERTAFAAKAALVPTVAAQANEHFTNATGLTGGHTAVYTASVTATWHIDWATAGGIRASNGATTVAEAREESSQIAARDRIHDAWQQVRSQIAKSRAARAQAQALQVAARIAKDRYESGVGTQLELIQAERDSFSAEAARIQADGDLLYARALLRIGAGRPLTSAGGGGGAMGEPTLPSTTPNTPGPAPPAPLPVPGAPAPVQGTPGPAPGGAPPQ
ncbi:MAG: TolC family protein [Polyangiaceae bacterium]